MKSLRNSFQNDIFYFNYYINNQEQENLNIKEIMERIYFIYVDNTFDGACRKFFYNSYLVPMNTGYY